VQQQRIIGRDHKRRQQRAVASMKITRHSYPENRSPTRISLEIESGDIERGKRTTIPESLHLTEPGGP